MWVLAILTVLTLGFGHRTLLDRRAAVYSLDHAQARMMARGAVSRGMMVLRNKLVDDISQEEVGMTHRGQEWARSPNMLEDDKFFTVDESFEDDIVTFVIQDESARVNINSAPEEVLAEIESLDASIRRKILVRRTEGEHEGEGGAVFHAIEELRYYRGVKDDEWFGSDRETGLKDLLTIRGGPQINVNTASELVLDVIPGVGDRETGVIMSYRAGSDGEIGTADDMGFKDIGELAGITGIDGKALEGLQRFGTTTSNIFTIHGIATRRHKRVRAHVSVTVSVNIERAEVRVLDWEESPLGA
jgi:DNA uptake protein ComE-like DNA-binding protein